MPLDLDMRDPEKAKVLFPSAVQTALSFQRVYREQVCRVFLELSYLEPALHTSILELNGQSDARAVDWLIAPHQGPATPFDVLAAPDGLNALSDLVSRESDRRLGLVRPTSSRGSPINLLDDLGA